jgi:hypothetical protein
MERVIRSLLLNNPIPAVALEHQNPLQHPLHLHCRPFAGAARGRNARLVQAVSNVPQ